jgi:hypothetical protein
MIYLIITTCINSNYGLHDNAHRQNQYLTCIRKTLSVLPEGIKPIIVENNGKRETYLDALGIDVLYTENNAITQFHKGVNELNDIKSVINHYNIQDDDMVIKVTGRYSVNDPYFFNYVMEHQNEYDSFVKFFNVCTLTFMQYDCVLGLFAMRCKHLKELVFQNRELSPEIEFAVHARNCGKVAEIQDLHITCCFANDFRVLDV